MCFSWTIFRIFGLVCGVFDFLKYLLLQRSVVMMICRHKKDFWLDASNSLWIHGSKSGLDFTYVTHVACHVLVNIKTKKIRKEEITEEHFWEQHEVLQLQVTYSWPGSHFHNSFKSHKSLENWPSLSKLRQTLCQNERGEV